MLGLDLNFIVVFIFESLCVVYYGEIFFLFCEVLFCKFDLCIIMFKIFNWDYEV